MVSTIRQKIRALCEDVAKSGFEVFAYTTVATFTLAQPNLTVLKVLKNGVELDSTEYDFDSVTNKITITPFSGNSLLSGDLIEVDFNYYKYSTIELNEYIRAALVWISVFCYDDKDYELDLQSAGDDVIDPTPDNRTTDLIALIASIIIKPDFSQYKLPNVTVVYPRTMPKEQRIEKLIGKYQMGLGVNDIIQFDIYPYDWNGFAR